MRKSLTLSLALAVTAWASLADCQEVKIAKVDNGGGTATVITDAKDCRITLVQHDATGKPLRSWTSLTDKDGKAVISTTEKLDRGRIVVRKLNLPDLIAPSNIVEGEVVMVALPKAKDGENVAIKTVEGEVVAVRKADPMGRLFLPVTLAAGAYLLSRHDGGKGSRIVVQSATGGNQLPGWADADLPIHLPNNGSGSACAAPQSAVNVELPVLAESPRESVFAPTADYGLGSGSQSLMIKDSEGRPVSVQTVSLFHLQGVINRQKLMSGEAARIEFRLDPPDLKGNLTVGVLNGPVLLPNGGQTQAITLTQGIATVAVQSIPGQTGPFQVGWVFHPDPVAANPGTEAQPPEPFKDPVTGDTVIVQEVGNGYIRHLIKHRDGTSSIVEHFDHGEFVKGEPLETVREIHTDGSTITTTEVLKHKDTGEVISGKRKKVKKIGDKEETQSEEKWDRAKQEWVAGK